MSRADWTNLSLEAEKAISQIHQLKDACRKLPKMHAVAIPALLDVTRQLAGNRKLQEVPHASTQKVAITMSNNLSLRLS